MFAIMTVQRILLISRPETDIKIEPFINENMVGRVNY